MEHVSTLNTGIVTGKKKPRASRSRNDAAKKTFIVTGIARSGTSLVAGLLREAGVFLGDFVYEVVNEDAQIIELLRSHDMPMLKTLIGERNACHATWGFKIPDLHTLLRHDDLALFRNPHLIVIYRDPVAVAVRNALSEHHEEMQALVTASNAMHALGRFVGIADCPVLLLSYEKALAFPNTMIDSMLDFCGIRLDDFHRNRLLVQVQPNRAEYLATATRRFVGRIDGILDGELYGWCVQEGRLEPVRLDLFANDQLVDTFRADRYRDDLAKGGVGNGCHGFFVDLDRYGFRGDTVIRVKVANRVLELDNSGQRLGRFEVAVSA